MTTIHQDILGMDQEDMVDEIMTLRQQKAALVEALERLVMTIEQYNKMGFIGGNECRFSTTDARAALKLAKAEQ